MEAIRDLIEWVANDSGSTVATLFPFALLGLAALYVLWLVVGYLRVSQVGVRESEHGGALQLSRDPDGVLQAPRGQPYCEVDGIAYPPGARFCTVCERDLRIDCATCGATLTGSDASCYRCGSRTGVADVPLLT